VKRLWERTVDDPRSGGLLRRFLQIGFRLGTPIYQKMSRRVLERRARSCSREWKAKVISVGSITVGGAGKTPVVMWLARRIIEHGSRVAIVHSGYGRSASSQVLIGYHDYDEHDVASCGDEVKAMITDLPEAAFAVGKDKKKMVIASDGEFAPDYILIDDGFQRLDIEKDADIAIITEDMSDAFNRLFPAGRLREPFPALNRADTLYVMGMSNRWETEMRCERILHQHGIQHSPNYWRFSFDSALIGDPPMPFAMLTTRRPFMFAGIGSFARLRAMLRSSRVVMAGFERFPDHHAYTEKDFEQLSRRAKECNADCYLTTTKDLVKLSHGSLALPLYALRLIVEPAEQFSIDAHIGLV
jgi:tetraacyldisaccharide 4'-kinase